MKNNNRINDELKSGSCEGTDEDEKQKPDWRSAVDLVVGGTKNNNRGSGETKQRWRDRRGQKTTTGASAKSTRIKKKPNRRRAEELHRGRALAGHHRIFTLTATLSQPSAPALLWRAKAVIGCKLFRDPFNAFILNCVDPFSYREFHLQRQRNID